MLSNVKHNHAIQHKLYVDGEDWSDRLLSASIQFRADAGSSGMEFSVTGSAEEYKDSIVNLWLGTGHETKPYFVGTLQAPNDDERLSTASARAYGPFKDMAEQVLGSNETFQGHTLEWVILNCARRTDRRPGDIIVRNGASYRVQQGEQFPFDNKIADVLSSLMDKANFVGVDQPGGRREFMPKPVPGSNENFGRTYDMDDYMEFNLTPSNETNFSKVVVYRNGDNGKPVVYAERDVNPISRRTPPRNRWFVVSDFPGTQKEAGDEAFRLALELRMGLDSFDVTIPFDKNIRVFGGFRLITIKRQVSRTYACFIDDGFTVDYSPGNPAIMSIGGKAYEIKKDRKQIHIPEKREVISPAIIPNVRTETFVATGIKTIEAESLFSGDWPDSYSSVVNSYGTYGGPSLWVYVGGNATTYWVDQAHLNFATASIPDNAEIESATLTVFVRDRGEHVSMENRNVAWTWHPYGTALIVKDNFLFNPALNAHRSLIDNVTDGGEHSFELFNANELLNRSGDTGLVGTIDPQTRTAPSVDSFLNLAGDLSGGATILPTLTVRYRIPEGA